MFAAILSHTPLWVWGLLVALIALGVSQTRTREVTLTRVTLLPLAMTVLSASGVFGAFGESAPAIVTWLAGLGAVLAFGRQALAVRGARWSAASERLTVPGSVLPLALILGIFVVKYTVGVTLALRPELATDSAFAAAIGAVYGVFAGLFLVRSLSLRGLAKAEPAPQAA